jgi:hypothetical protein
MMPTIPWSSLGAVMPMFRSGRSALQVGTDLPVAILVAAVLVWLGMIIARRVSERDPWPALRTVMIVSVFLHLVCAPLQIFVVHHFYGGVADWLRYDHQGALMADNLRHGHFTFSGTTIGQKFINDGSVSFYGGIVMTLIGPNQLGAFFVSAWLAFVGTVFFYRAFAVTFPGVDRRFYAKLIFLFPSILFWTADVGKEAVMLFALGLTAYGMAQIFVGIRRGYLYALIGGALGIIIRPNELAILVGGFAIAMVVRSLYGVQTPGDPPRRRGGLRTIGSFVFVGAAVALVAYEASHLLHPLTTNGHGGITGALSNLSKGNTGTGAGFGSSNIPYSPNPLTYPRDVYTVLFDPFWFNAGSVTQIIESVENTLIFGVLIYSMARLRYLFRVCAQRPYVLMALIYSLLFIYAFAALGNLGLITRERTLLLPLLFVVLAFPVARAGERPYPWQVRRAKHKKTRLGPGPDERVPTDPVVHTMATVQWESRFADGSQAEWSRSDWGADT